MLIYFFIILFFLLSFFYQLETYKTNYIPKIIIQTWKTKNNIPTQLQQHSNKLKNLHPDYQYLFFTDYDIEVFLKSHYPHYYQTYLQLPLKIQKIDFFRYIVVYHYGGFYFDLDMNIHTKIDNLRSYKVVFPVEQQYVTCKKPRFELLCKDQHLPKPKIIIGNYAFGAEPKNLFLKHVIDHIHTNIQQIKQNRSHDKNYVYITTGPDLISLQFHAFTKTKPHLLRSYQNHRFGRYGNHEFMGSWKNTIFHQTHVS